MNINQKEINLNFMYNVGMYGVGTLIFPFFFILNLFLDNIFNTFNYPIFYMIIFPIILTYINLIVVSEGLDELYIPPLSYVLGNLSGLIISLVMSLEVPNIYNFILVEHMAFNLTKYFTPMFFVLLFFLIICLYRKIHLKKIVEEEVENINTLNYINKVQEEWDILTEDEKQYYIENRENPMQAFLNSFKEMSDKVSANIDPDYEKEDEEKRD